MVRLQSLGVKVSPLVWSKLVSKPKGQRIGKRLQLWGTASRKAPELRGSWLKKGRRFNRQTLCTPTTTLRVHIQFQL